MRLDAQLPGGVVGAADAARKAVRLGHRTIWSAEVNHDPMLPLAAAAAVTGPGADGSAAGAASIELGTNVVLAFARNPFSVALGAWDLAAATNGRFLLGLGTQVKPHVTRRFSMPWHGAAPQMREFVAALRHCWDCFQHGTKMDFRGDFYQHTLLHPLFNPGPIAVPQVPVGLGGVGPRMTRLAGEVADFYLNHAFTNTAYQDRVTFPELDAGLATSGRTRSDIWTFGYVELITGDTEAEWETSERRVRDQLAFYASSPMYVAVLEAIGYEALQPELETLAKAGRWSEMGAVLDDGFLDHFAVRGTLEELPGRIRERYTGYYDRFVAWIPLRDVDPDRLAAFVAACNDPNA